MGALIGVVFFGALWLASAVVGNDLAAGVLFGSALVSFLVFMITV